MDDKLKFDAPTSWADEADAESDRSKTATPEPSSTGAQGADGTATVVAKGHDHIKIGGKGVTLKDGKIDWHDAIAAELQNKDSAIYSECNSFEELNLRPDLLQGVFAMGFTKPSRIQAKAFPIILKHPPGDLIAQSQSGTGKTAAFSLGMLSQVKPELKYPQALCLSPTRELTRQTYDVVTTMGKFTSIQVLEGVPGKRFDRGTQFQEQIIVATPGICQTWIRQRFFDPRKVIMMVFDEADQMLAQGMRDDSLRIKKELNPNHQTLLFSATYSDELREFAKKVCPSATMIDLPREKLTLDAIAQFVIDCSDKNQRYDVLCDIYGSFTIGQLILFCETRATADDLYNKMIADGHAVTVLYGGQKDDKVSMEKDKRDEAIDKFRRGATRVLITTNVLARGIDIDQVNVVINYDLPLKWETPAGSYGGRPEVVGPDTETYLHRIGRTGRFGRRGVAINFVYDNRSRQYMKEIERHFNRQASWIKSDEPERFEEMFEI